MPRGRPKKIVTEVKEVEKEAEVKNVPRRTCDCGHVEKIHYGGKNAHCNTQNCVCQEFK